MPEFICRSCQQTFTVKQSALDPFPGWQPKVCLSCKGKAKGKEQPKTNYASPSSAPVRRYPRASAEENLPCAEVLRRYSDGPLNGLFCDGAAHPNPGPGGYGAVYVLNNQVVDERSGYEEHTTNNRMELMALKVGLTLVPKGTTTTVFTDSELCVNIFTKWAASWERQGWRRKDGEIKNLELVKTIYAELKKRPEFSLSWIKAHQGLRWNEYADALATAYRREDFRDTPPSR